MSDKHDKAPEVLDENGDELIHVPKGQSRLRYLATIALVLFLLVIFVVADLFQSTLTGGSGGEDSVFITWEDPLSGETESVKKSDFFDTGDLLTKLASPQAGMVYRPPSFYFRDLEAEDAPTRPDVEDEDTAAFLIYEDMARDAGIAISDQEHTALLKAIFRTNANANAFARRAGMSKLALSEGIRRVQRVQKLQELIMATQLVPDSSGAVTRWQEDQPDYKFEVVSVPATQFEAQAKTEVPTDEELLEWFHARPLFEQQRLFTQPRVVYEAAYVDLDADEAFDATALLAAYPMAEDADVDQLTQNYYDLNQRLRFMKPAEPVEPDGGEGEGEDDGGEGEEGEPAEPQQTQPAEPYPFEEVQERARAEAEIKAALDVFLVELQDAVAAGDEIDLVARATELGLSADRGADEGVTRAEIPDIEGWGSRSISGQLSFAAEGTFVPRVVISEDAMTIARVTRKIEAQEPPFDEIRDEVVDLWAEERASELAQDALNGLRATLVAKPEDVEHADWVPVIDKEALRQLAAEAQYSFYDREPFGRGEMPENQTEADTFLRMQSDIYELEEGQVPAARVGFDKSTAYLVRFDSKVMKSPLEIDVSSFESYQQRNVNESLRALGGQVFRGDGAWLTGRTGLRFPEKERLEKERAERDAAEG